MDRDTRRIPRKEHSGKSDQLLQSNLLLQMFVYVPGESHSSAKYRSPSCPSRESATLGRPVFVHSPATTGISTSFDGLDLADGGDQDELEDEKGEKSGRDDGQEELLHARKNFGSRAWLLEDLIPNLDVAIILYIGHFMYRVNIQL